MQSSANRVKKQCWPFLKHWYTILFILLKYIRVWKFKSRKKILCHTNHGLLSLKNIQKASHKHLGKLMDMSWDTQIQKASLNLIYFNTSDEYRLFTTGCIKFPLKLELKHNMKVEDNFQIFSYLKAKYFCCSSEKSTQSFFLCADPLHCLASCRHFNTCVLLK